MIHRFSEKNLDPPTIRGFSVLPILPNLFAHFCFRYLQGSQVMCNDCNMPILSCIRGVF